MNAFLSPSPPCCLSAPRRSPRPSPPGNAAASSASTSPAAAARRSADRGARSCRRRRTADTPAGEHRARSAARSPRSSPPISRNSGLFTPGRPGRHARRRLRRGDRARFRLLRDHRRAASSRASSGPIRQRPAHRRLLPLRRRRADRADPPGLCRRSRATGAAPRTNAPTPSIRACPARAPSSTAGSPISPRPAQERRRIKRLAIMDSDGANHRFLTNGQSTVLTPRFSPEPQSRSSI